MDNESVFDLVIQTLHEKKAQDVKAIDISDLTTIAQYFVVCSGSSVTHIKTLADYVEEKLNEQGMRCIHREGYNSARWILLDYGDIVVHVIHEEDREFYGLERLWQDGKPIAVDEVQAAKA
jgi:ribosome-associated protein